MYERKEDVLKQNIVNETEWKTQSWTNNKEKTL